MADKLQTSIVIDLAGNLDKQAKKYGRAFDRMGSRATKGFGVINRSAALASKGLDKIGNRYSGAAAGAISAKVIKDVADFDKIMTRIGTNAGMTTDELAELKQQIQEVASASDINISRDDLALAVDTLKGRGADLDFVKDNVRNLALSIQGLGADAQSSGELMFTMFDAGIRGSDNILNTMDSLFYQFQEGSISIKELARESPKLFAQLVKGGEESVVKMGALFQTFGKVKGSAAEVTSAVEATFRVLQNADKVKMLEGAGIKVFEDDAKTKMRDQFDIIMEILSATDKLGDRQLQALGPLFDETALGGLRGFLQGEGASNGMEMYKRLSKGAIEYGQTAAAANANAQIFGSVLTGIYNKLSLIATTNLSAPLQDFSEWLNKLDSETIDLGVTTAKWVAGLVAGYVAVKKLYGFGKEIKVGVDFIRGVGKDKTGKGGLPGGAGLGVQKVFVVNMPGSGMRGGKSRSNKKNRRTPKATLPKPSKSSPTMPTAKGALATSPAMGRFGKAVPGVGTALSAVMLTDALMNGDAEDIGSSSGAIAGAMAGAAIGSFVPVLGTAIGGIIGGLLGEYAGGAVGKQFVSDANSTNNTSTTNNSTEPVAQTDQKGIEEAVVRGLTQGMAALSLNVNVKQGQRVGSGLDVRLANGPTLSVMGG